MESVNSTPQAGRLLLRGSGRVTLNAAPPSGGVACAGGPADPSFQPVDLGEPQTDAYSP